MPDEILRMRATVVSEEALANIRKIGSAVERIPQQAGRGLAQANTQFQTLGATIKNVGRELSQAVPALGGFGLGAAGIGLAAGAVIRSLSDMSKKIVELRYVSKELGLSEQSIKGFVVAAQKAGIAPETMMQGLAGFKRNTEDFKLRIGDVRQQLVALGAAPVLARINAATNELDKLKEAFDFKEELDKADPSGVKARRFFEVLQLGPQLARLSWSQYMEERARQPILSEAEKKKFEDFNRLMVDLGETWGHLTVGLGGLVLPGLIEGLGEVNKTIAAIEKLLAILPKLPKPGDFGARVMPGPGVGEPGGPVKVTPGGARPWWETPWRLFQPPAPQGSQQLPPQGSISGSMLGSGGDAASALWNVIKKPFVTTHDVAAGRYAVKPQKEGEWSEEDEFRQQMARKQEIVDAFGMAGYGVQAKLPGSLKDMAKNLAPENLPGAIAKAGDVAGEPKPPLTVQEINAARAARTPGGATRGIEPISFRGLDGTPAANALQESKRVVKEGTLEALIEWGGVGGGDIGGGGGGGGGGGFGGGIGRGRVGRAGGLGGGSGGDTGPGGVGGPGGQPGGPGGASAGPGGQPGGRPGGAPPGSAVPGSPTSQSGDPNAMGPAAALAFAREHLGEDEIADRSKLSQFFASKGMTVDPKTTAWCADFVNANLQSAGIKGTGSSAAGSFTKYGTAVQPGDLQPGDIGVVKGRSPRTGMEGTHVGFLTGESRVNPNTGQLEYKMIGGNQGGTSSGKGGVSEQWRPASSLNVRRPPGATLPNGQQPSAQAPAGTPDYSGGTKATWFHTGAPIKTPGGTWDDPSGRAEGLPASGMPSSTPGIATPGRGGLGEWYQVTLPDGRVVVTQKTDIGPGKGAQAKGIGLDIDASLASTLYPGGPGTFPSGKGGFKVTRIGKDLPPGMMPGVQPRQAGTQPLPAPPQGAQAPPQSAIAEGFEREWTGKPPPGSVVAPQPPSDAKEWHGRPGMQVSPRADDDGHGVGGGGEGSWRRGGRNPKWARRETFGVGGGDEDGMGGAEALARAEEERRIDNAISPMHVNGSVNVTVNSNGTKADTNVKNKGGLFQKSTVRQHRQMRRTEDAGSGASGEAVGAD